MSDHTCWCSELGPLSLRSGDVCRGCEEKEAKKPWTSWNSGERAYAQGGTYNVDIDPGDEDRTISAKELGHFLAARMQR